ncbi:LacI family DNA-binding transcriptional regulator [Parvularcula dongshanensis]|uniref:DNA-binding LacI/PurR family transcriptional regulator n=1 Tax=Parvularcula dongshanensis TaxID=1173995 RepID=A0A840I6C2_9PROT|nr:LacI family DNA-binding transcriptional regulator [Parvularcula dongshanensis]MBB4659688.1 DNA-binding LacI/PurR family transcriptional regulator [Parvularcula dongshanensis]
MFDIAQLAGVSEATVSRALSGSPLIAESTRMRVLQVARSANYQVNINARSLRQKRSRSIEVLIPLATRGRQHMSDPFYLDMLGALADALAARSYDLLLTKRAPWLDGVEKNSIQCGRADGIIIMGQGQDLEELDRFASMYPQIIVWGGHLPDHNYVVVGTDNVVGGKMATEHLMQVGRKRIAFLGDPAEPEIALRLEGYKRAHAENGMTLDESLIYKAPFDAREARIAAEATIEGGVRFDALFCASDVIAMSTVTALRRAEIRVPHDVAVVGYDDIRMSANFDPALTTISQQIQQGGETMVDLLLTIIDGGSASTTLLPPELIVRESTVA